jgi:protein-disulfide isomerase
MRLLAFSATIALLSACVTSDGARRATDQSAAAAPAVGTPRVDSSGGTLGAAGARDSITDRADRGRILGDSSAPVWLIMASDFQCPWCKRWHDSTFAPIVQNYVRTGKVRMAYLNYPMQMHPNAVPAAEAAMCASLQGKFWQMHDALFADQEKWSELPKPQPVLDAIAARVGVSMPGWQQCMSKHSMLPLIAADRDRASSAGVQSTPTFFVGDRRVVGAAPYAAFRDSIEAALAKVRSAGRAGKSPSP